MALVLLREDGEHPQVARRAELCRELAQERGVAVHELRGEGGSPFERLARLVCLTDYASAYLALASGIDPTPVAPITALKAALAR